MSIADLYRKTKQILNDSNAALINKGLSEVVTLNSIPAEINKLESINRLPYVLSKDIIELTLDDLMGVTSIGSYNFSDCVNLASVIIPDGVTEIGFGAFQGCTNLASVIIPDGVTEIENQAFLSCRSLTDITIPDTVTVIGLNAFLDTAYYNEKSNWEDNLLYIGHYLISSKNKSAINELNIKEGTKCIAQDVFSNCTSLTSVTIPDSVTNLGVQAFYGCTSLTSVTIGNNVTVIGQSAFSNCTSLTSVTIPDSVTTILYRAFYGCTSLIDMYMYSTTPPTLERTNAISTATATIHVPIGSGDVYRTATNWSTFADKIVEDIIVR